MENKKATPFTDGNKWRFQAGNLSAKRVTKKQLIRQVEGLLVATEEELNEIVSDTSVPYAVRQLSQSILSGSPVCVAEFLVKYSSYGD